MPDKVVKNKSGEDEEGDSGGQEGKSRTADGYTPAWM
jgi:hypothetical protein